MKSKQSTDLSWKVILFVYLTASIATAVAHDWFVDSRFYEIRNVIHEQVLENSAPAPIQYRVFVYYFSELLQKTGLTLKSSYLFIRFLPKSV